VSWLSDRRLGDEARWLAALPLIAALALAVARWPSDAHVAQVADRRLLLNERLGTAVDLSSRLRQSPARVGRFDQLQLRDAIDRAEATPLGWLAVDRNSRRELVLVSALLVLAAGSLLLPRLQRPGFLTTPTRAAGQLGELAPGTDMETRAVPDAIDSTGSAAAVPVQSSPPDTDLASRVQQQLAERDAFDKLAHALGQLSAGQPAADAIQRGDFSAARQQLTTLGEEADQLSEAAKRQLARDLQQAADATAATDRQLAERERQAAAALSRNNYVEQRQALSNLADQVDRSGARTAPADQLARDIGRLQQQSNRPGPPSSSAADGAQSAAQQPQPAAGAGALARGDANGPPGPGTGTGPGQDGADDKPARLDSAGQNVAVPARLSAGPGVRTPDGTEDQLGSDPTASASSVSELVQAQRTGQVAAEQNLVPGEQRSLVRGYFR
jgi:hypothetical protein